MERKGGAAVSDNKESHGRANDVIKMMKDREVKLHDLRRLHSVNAALLEALRTALDASYDGPMADHAREKARAAIAKAEEVKP